MKRTWWLAAFIILFVMARDLMTPFGLWQVSLYGLRFRAHPIVLVLFGLISLAMVFGTQLTIGGLEKREVWAKRSVSHAIGLGIIAGGAIALLGELPRFFAYGTAPRPITQLSMIAGVACLAFCGNLLEEVLFRGHLHAVFRERGFSTSRVIVMSGVAFMAFHLPLAFVVTTVGMPVLVFTLFEGLVCAFIRERTGLIAAAIAHGLGIFLLAVL